MTGAAPIMQSKRRHAERCASSGDRPTCDRLRYIKDPDTGRRVSRLNSASDWVEKAVPHLRMISDDIWRRAKARQAGARAKVAAVPGKSVSPSPLRRPKFLFSGLTICGECGAGFHVYSGDRLACYGNRVRHTCSNQRTIRRGEVERRVLVALQDKMLQPELIEEFSREFTREMNRLRMEYRATASSARLERTGCSAKSTRWSARFSTASLALN